MQTWYPRYEALLKKKRRKFKAKKPGNQVKRFALKEAKRISAWKHKGTPGWAV